MAKKKTATRKTTATPSRSARATAAAAANPVRPEDVKQPSNAPKAARVEPASPTPTRRETELAPTPRLPFRRPQSLNFAGLGRNDICPCGSGKRFKNCHGH